MLNNNKAEQITLMTAVYMAVCLLFSNLLKVIQNLHFFIFRFCLTLSRTLAAPAFIQVVASTASLSHSRASAMMQATPVAQCDKAAQQVPAQNGLTAQLIPAAPMMFATYKYPMIVRKTISSARTTNTLVRTRTTYANSCPDTDRGSFITAKSHHPTSLFQAFRCSTA